AGRAHTLLPSSRDGSCRRGNRGKNLRAFRERAYQPWHAQGESRASSRRGRRQRCSSGKRLSAGSPPARLSVSRFNITIVSPLAFHIVLRQNSLLSFLDALRSSPHSLCGLRLCPIVKNIFEHRKIAPQNFEHTAH